MISPFSISNPHATYSAAMTPSAVHFGFPIGVSTPRNQIRGRGGAAGAVGAASSVTAAAVPGINRADSDPAGFLPSQSGSGQPRGGVGLSRRSASVYVEGPLTSSSRDEAGNGEEFWACLACTFQNNHLMDHCEVCEMPRYLCQNPQWGM